MTVGVSFPKLVTIRNDDPLEVCGFYESNDFLIHPHIAMQYKYGHVEVYRSQSRYAQYETGDRKPKLLEAMRIAEVLGETVEYLFAKEQKQGAM